jgi:hypothetical protein
MLVVFSDMLGLLSDAKRDTIIMEPLVERSVRRSLSTRNCSGGGKGGVREMSVLTL